MGYKLSYTILGRRTEVVSGQPLDSMAMAVPDVEIDIVEVEWRHSDGPIQDTVLLPTLRHTEKKWKDENGDEQIDLLPVRGFEVTPSGVRSVIKDSVRVKKSTPDSVVMQILEEKRAAIAKSLGVEP